MSKAQLSFCSTDLMFTYSAVFKQFKYVWKELSKCLDDVSSKCLVKRKQFQLFPHAPVLLKDKQL